MSFVDTSRFYVKAGDGGDGCVSFRREKYVPKGGPNGGDGGRGGDVIIRASSRIASLIDFQYRSHFKADNGQHGQGKDRHGRNGADRIIDVPVGSVLIDDDSGNVIVEFLDDGEEYTVARGGKGGLGNPHFASAANRTPRKATKGRKGDDTWLRIELKLLADIGLVGLPNAGKSSLLQCLTAARPKIGDYPFTTLEPQLGVLQLADHEPVVIADIPGLIAGAHEGVGLGDRFLRHIERTSVILHVLDISSDDYMYNFKTITQELQRYQQELVERIQVIALNKVDLVDTDMAAEIRQDFLAAGMNAFVVSAATGYGIEGLKRVLVSTLEAAKDIIIS